MSHQNTWISLNQICRWIWIPCSLLLKQPLFESFLAILPYSVVYDPTAFMVCELVIVAWLKAYGAVTKPRAPCGTAATWWRCSARAGIEVVDQVPLLSYTDVPLLLQNILLGNIQVFKREIDNKLMKSCSLKVSKRMWFWRKNVWHGLSLHERRMWSRKGKQKEDLARKVSLG